MKVAEDCANSLEIGNYIRPSRYFRSSLKIIRMADELDLKYLLGRMLFLISNELAQSSTIFIC